MKNLIFYLILFAVSAFLGFRLATVQDQVKSKEQVIKEKNARLRIWKDEAGKHHAEKLAANVTIQDLKQELDSVKDLPPDVRTYTKIETKTEDSIVTDIKYDTIQNTDTLYIGTFSYRDQWSQIKGSVWSDKVSINYFVKDSIELFTEWKSQGWFKPKQLYVSGISHNKNTKITGLKNYSTSATKDRFALVVGTGGALTTKGFIYTPLSVTAGYKIFGF